MGKYEKLKNEFEKIEDKAHLIKKNREVIAGYSVSDESLADLLVEWEQYFNRGFYVNKTPEEIKKEILLEIKKIEEYENEQSEERSKAEGI